MRFCRYQTAAGETGIGVQRGEEIVPLENVMPEAPPRPAQRLPIAGDLAALHARLDDAEAFPTAPRLLAPVPAPEKVICVGLNYRDHALETGAEIPTQPVIFNKFPSAIIGPGDPIVLPAVSDRVDYEAELVVVIGTTARHVAAADALKHVFGYCCGHDVSARDWQKGTPGGQWLLGKTFDSFAPIGPWVVSRDEVPDSGNLRVELRIDGETLQDSRTTEFIFDVPQVIEYLTQVTTLRPGDLIFTGTPPGVGAARKPPRFLRAGDTCEVEIEGLGILSNPVAAETPNP